MSQRWRRRNVDAGLSVVEVEQREYGVEMATDDYVSMFDVFAYGRFLHDTLGERGWREFGRRIREVASERCGPQIRYVARLPSGHRDEADVTAVQALRRCRAIARATPPAEYSPSTPSKPVCSSRRDTSSVE